jgi:serine/threonine protein kinase
VVGYPDESFLKEISDDARTYIIKLENKPNKCDYQQKFPEITNKQAINLIELMLKLNPKERMDCESLLEHRYFNAYHDADDEPICEKLKDTYEEQSHSIDEWKERIYQEIRRFKI